MQVSIRSTEIDDAPRLFELIEHSRDNLAEFLPWANVTLSVQDEESAIKQMHQKENNGELEDFVVLLNEDIVGKIDIHNISNDYTHGEIGYWLADDYTGKHIMSQALSMVEDYAFLQKQFTYLDLKVNIHNVNSQHLPISHGYQHVDTLDDMLTYRLTYQQWLDR